MVDFYGVGTGLLLRKTFQRGWQIARAVGVERCAKIFLLVRRKLQIVQIKNGGIIKTPLQNVIGYETRRENGRFSEIDDGLLAVGEQQGGLFVSKFNFAINHRKPRFICVIHGHDKFSSFHSGDGSARDDLDSSGLVAVEKRNDSADQMQPALRVRQIGRQNLDFRRSAQWHDALVGPKERDTAVRAGTQPVKGMQDLISLDGNPDSRAGWTNLHRALKSGDPDFVGGLAALGNESSTPSRETPQNHDPEKPLNDFRK